MRLATLTLCAMLAAARSSAGPPTWIEVKSAHFTVITNAGDAAGRRVAWQFEQIRSALSGLWPWAKVDSGRPFVVFAAKDEATLRTLGPQYWEEKRYRPTSFWTTRARVAFSSRSGPISGSRARSVRTHTRRPTGVTPTLSSRERSRGASRSGMRGASPR